MCTTDSKKQTDIKKGEAETSITEPAIMGGGSEEERTNVHVSAHPVLSHKITKLRSSATRPSDFRAVLREVTYHLGYEATSKLTTRPVAISVPVPVAHHSNGNNKTQHDHMDYEGVKIKERVALIPILRSGLGMVDPMLELLPKAAVHHIGMYKGPKQNQPIQYFNRLPRKCEADVAYVLDPVIATSTTVMAVVRILKKWGVSKIHIVSVLGSKSGLAELSDSHPDVSITVGTVDSILKDGQVLPGLGDSGDRLYGTEIFDEEDEEEELLHPSKRSRSNSTTISPSATPMAT